MHTLTPHITTYMGGRRATGTYGPKSQRVVQPRLRSLSDHFGRRPIHHLTRRAIEAWLGDLDHLAPNSRAAYLASVRGFCAWLHLEGHLGSDPCDGIPRPTRTRPIPRAIDRTHVRAILDACATDRDQLIVWLMVSLGLRRMEVAGLRWEDIDHRSGLLTVRTAKGGRQRILPIPPELATVLATTARRTHGPVVTSTRDPHAPISAERVGQIVSRLMATAGIKAAPYDGVSGHALRHTAASDILDQCGDLRVVQDVLGHAQLATTAIYLRRTSASAMLGAISGRDYATG